MRDGSGGAGRVGAGRGYHHGHTTAVIRPHTKPQVVIRLQRNVCVISCAGLFILPSMWCSLAKASQYLLDVSHDSVNIRPSIPICLSIYIYLFLVPF